MKCTQYTVATSTW